MYTSIRRYQTGSPEEVTRRVREGFVPLVRKIHGFLGYYAIAGDGVWASISVFQDRAGVEESNRLAAEWASEHVKDLLLGPPEITEGESVIQEMVTPVAA